jgi:hypothetical protein
MPYSPFDKLGYLVIKRGPNPAYGRVTSVTFCDELQQAAKLCSVDRGEIIQQLKRTGRYDRADGLFTVITDKLGDEL